MPKPIIGQTGWGQQLNDFLDTKADVGSWTPYDPTVVAGITLGNGTLDAVWMQVQPGLVAVRVNIVFGTTTAITGNVSISLPVAATGATWCPTSHVDTGSAYNLGLSRIAGSSLIVYANLVVGTVVRATNLTPTVPHTWAATDEIQVSGLYRVAS